jgi:choline monooxygenase
MNLFFPLQELYWKKELHHDANWKIPVENTLESYHTTEVHPKTFGTYPEERWCTHELHGWWDMLRVDYSTYQTNRSEKFIGWLTGIEPDFDFRHMMRYPNVVWSIVKWYDSIWMICTISPNRTREVIWTFGHAGDTRRPGSRVARRLLKWHARAFSERVRAEDAATFPRVQRGMEATDRPLGGGLISIREERIFPFQQYILENTSGSDDAPMTQGAYAPRSPLHSF